MPVDFKTLTPFQKADIALSDLATAGVLNPTQQDRFIRKLTDSPTILNMCRVIPMPGPKYEINKIAIGSRFLHGANQGVYGSRSLAAADRGSFTTSKVTLDTVELIGEIEVPYEVLEDSIEREALEATLLDLMASQSAVDMEDFIINANTAAYTAATDDMLCLRDGVLALATENIVNMGGAAGISPNVFEQMLITMPDKYKRNLNNLRFIASTDLITQYKGLIAQRQTNLGDQILTAGIDIQAFGVRMVGASLMPNTNVLLIDPLNIIFGVQRNVTVELDKDIRERVVQIVLTTRCDVKIQETEAITNATGLRLNTYSS